MFHFPLFFLLLIQTLSLSTVWDDQLCYLLSPALAAYELERATGLVPGKAEFEDAVRRIVPDGHTFKAFPIHFNHRQAHRVLETALRSASPAPTCSIPYSSCTGLTGIVKFVDVKGLMVGFTRLDI